jgi:hypothetical protein
VVDLAAKNAADDAARAALDKAYKDQLQLAAGYVSAAQIALATDPSPSLSSKIADLMAAQAQDVVGAPTSAQVRQFTSIIKELAAENASLAASNANLKDVVLKTTTSFEQATQENAQVKGQLLTAQQTNQQTLAAKDAAVKQAQTVSAAADKKVGEIEIVHQTFVERVKHWVLGLGFFGIAVAVLVLVAMPIVAQAYPALKPAIKGVSNLFLKFWDILHEEEKKLLVAAHLETQTKLVVAQTQLSSEQAAHAATKAVLVAAVTAAPAKTP